LRQRHGFEHGFPLIRSLRAPAQRSTSVLFSFVLSLLIVAGSLAIRQSKTIPARDFGAGTTREWLAVSSSDWLDVWGERHGQALLNGPVP
jgi:hypothetical protein